jgi:hypothetical protein
MGKKSDNAETLKRVEEVLRIRLDGAQFHDIVQYGSEQGWNVGERQIRKYIARADDLLVERQEKSRKRLLARHVAQREALFARALNAADYRTALAVADSTAKLQGLFTDARDQKELAKLAASQAERLRDLEKRLDDARRAAEAVPQAGPAPGPAGGCPADPGSDDGPVPPGPGPPVG